MLSGIAILPYCLLGSKSILPNAGIVIFLLGRPIWLQAYNIAYNIKKSPITYLRLGQITSFYGGSLDF